VRKTSRTSRGPKPDPPAKRSGAARDQGVPEPPYIPIVDPSGTGTEGGGGGGKEVPEDQAYYPG
jgi:hypothetical protein